MSTIVTAEKTNNNLTVKVETEDNSMRQGAKTLNVVILMKSPYYARTWKLSGIIGLTDPCFENTVAAISA